MAGTLANDQHTNVMTHRSNGARLVSTSGETLPLRTVSLTSEVAGGIARTIVHQHFTNEHSSPLELQYLFPLPVDGGITSYEIAAGRRRIVGRLERRDDARAEYDAARLAGRTASLVEQHRPNLFTQHLGNIPPATDVIVRLAVDHPLTWVQDVGWEWRFPTVVAPRYLGREGMVSDAAKVTVDVTCDSVSPQASLAVTILDDVHGTPTSPSHPVLVNGTTVTLTNSAVLDRDIVIRWSVPTRKPGCSVRVAGATADAACSSTPYAVLTIVPPTTGVTTLPRDLVLLLDVSGSMAGKPLECLRSVVTALIEALGEQDRLEMVAFSSESVRYSQGPVRTTDAERRKALAWVESLRAGGGTQLISAIEEALRPVRDGVSRQVIVVTDGLIGFEAAAVRAIRDGLPTRSRLHAVGVGSASNRAFLRPAARAGRGVEIVIDLDETAEQGVARILAGTSQPVVTDVTILGTALLDGAPRMPDLLRGSPVLAGLRLRNEGGTLVVRGQTADGPWEEHVAVAALHTEASEMIRAYWAREAIENLELDLACGGSQNEIDTRIEQIALEHSVSSRLTSWIAVAEESSVDPRDPVRVDRIPQMLPYGMSAERLGLEMTRPLMPSALGTVSESLAQRGVPSELTLSAQLETKRVRSRDALSRLEAESQERHRQLSELDEHANRAQAALRQMTAELHEIEAHRRDLLSRLADLDASAGRAREETMRLISQMQEINERRRELAVDRERWERQLDAARAELSHIEAIAREPERRFSAAESLDVAARVPAPLHGRIYPTPGRPTSTLEITATYAFDWRPSGTATIAGRTVALTEEGTTRGGTVMAGMLVRAELAIAPDDLRASRRVELASGGSVLLVELDVVG